MVCSDMRVRVLYLCNVRRTAYSAQFSLIKDFCQQKPTKDLSNGPRQRNDGHRLSEYLVPVEDEPLQSSSIVYLNRTLECFTTLVGRSCMLV